MSWLSQYPHEKEVLFAPLTGLEVQRTRVEGRALVVDVRLSVNLQARTIEQVVAKMQTSHVQILMDRLKEDCEAQSAGVSRCRELRQE